MLRISDIFVQFMPRLYAIFKKNNVSLTAGHSQRAHLPIERVQFQVHRARQRQRDANAVQHRAVRKDPNVHVRHDDVVEVTLLLVGEEQIGHPHAVRLGQRQVFQTAYTQK